MYINGKIVKEALRKEGLSQIELSNMISYDNSSVSKVLKGIQQIPDDKVKEICDLLNVKVSDIAYSDDYIPKIVWNNNYFLQQLIKNAMSSADLCNRIHCDKSLPSYYKRKKSVPSYETALKICTVLNCSAKKLVGITMEQILKGLLKQSKDATEILESIDANENLDAVIENDDCVTDADCIADDIVADFTHFDNTNVINNINIINENIILLATRLAKNNEALTRQVKEIAEQLEDARSENGELINRLSELERLVKANAVGAKTRICTTNYATSVPNVPANLSNKCSDDEIKAIVSSTLDEHIKFDDYRNKIYKLVNYIARKKKLIFNQVMHDSYENFAKTYGFSYANLKSETKTKSSIEALHANELTRVIFFNMLCKNASDCILVNK